jgi:hypothetical protein
MTDYHLIFIFRAGVNDFIEIGKCFLPKLPNFQFQFFVKWTRI